MKVHTYEGPLCAKHCSSSSTNTSSFNPSQSYQVDEDTSGFPMKLMKLQLLGPSHAREGPCQCAHKVMCSVKFKGKYIDILYLKDDSTHYKNFRPHKNMDP